MPHGLHQTDAALTGSSTMAGPVRCAANPGMTGTADRTPCGAALAGRVAPGCGTGL